VKTITVKAAHVESYLNRTITNPELGNQCSYRVGWLEQDLAQAINDPKYFAQLRREIKKVAREQSMQEAA